MKKGIVLLAGVVALAALGYVLVQKGYWTPSGALAQWLPVPPAAGQTTGQAPAPQGPRGVAVEVATAVKKKTPVSFEALGTVTPIASVALKTRIDSEITAVHFADGASVKQGDVLITLDARAIDAQIKQVEGNIARDKAQLEGAQRDVNRYTELVAKSATPVTNLDNAKTQAAIYTAAVMADEAALQNLKVQLSYTSIRAPITGRISAAALKVGNIVRAADLAAIATIVQTAPVYVSFPMPQTQLPALRQALTAESATIQAMIPGDTRPATGTVSMIENTVDPATGMVTVRATMPNTTEILWPGTLVNVQLTMREEETVVVPTAAIQVNQTGSFVFVVKGGKAATQPVKVARTLGRETALESGLSGGEVVVTDGHLQLTNGANVMVRERKAGA
jgi:multidrug efflux system membrane fusion protein